MKVGISREEYRRRTEAVTATMKEKGLDAFIFWNSNSSFYLTGFSFIATERPSCLILAKDGSKTIFIPKLEIEHADVCSEISHKVVYDEYPGKVHPMRILGEALEREGLGSSTIGCDALGYGGYMGYEGPSLTDISPKAKFVTMSKLVERLRMIKSREELDLIREAARWGTLGHDLLQRYSKPGFDEDSIAHRASSEATDLMMRTLGESYDPHVAGTAHVPAGFRGQVGPNSALPHAIAIHAVLRPGDVLVTYSCPWVAGYTCELERTMFVGQPTEEQVEFFHHMVEIQDTAFENIRPGRKCSDVDNAVRAVYEKRGLTDYWRHHTGHALGIGVHEPPFFDTGDDTVLRPGMVFSVEPGVFVPGLGGFRHSDTVVVTETGMEIITYYPRRLENLICG